MIFKKLALLSTFLLAQAAQATTITISSTAEKPYNGADPATLASSQTLTMAQGETRGIWMKMASHSGCHPIVATNLGSFVTVNRFQPQLLASTLKSYSTAATSNYDPDLSYAAGDANACDNGFAFLEISVANPATPGDQTITLTLNGSSVTVTVRILTLAMPSTFTNPFYMGMISNSLGQPFYGSGMNVTQQGSIAAQGASVLRAHGIEPYLQNVFALPQFNSTTTATLSAGSSCLSSVGSTTNFAVGAPLFDTTSGHTAYIPAGTTVTGKPGACAAGQIQMSANATTSASGDTIQPGSLNLDQFSANGASFRQLTLTGNIYPPDLTWTAESTSDTNLASVNLMQTMDYYITSGQFGTNPWCYTTDEGQGDPTRTAAYQLVINRYRTNMPHCKLMTTRENDGSLTGLDWYEPVMDFFGQPGHLGASSYGSVTWGIYGSCMAQGSCSGSGQSNTPTGTPMMVLDAPSVHQLAYVLMNPWAGGTRQLYYSTTDAYGSWTDPWNANGHGNGDGTMFYPAGYMAQGDVTSGSNCVTNTTNTGFHVGDRISGTGIPSTATVAGVPGTCGVGNVQMSANATSTVVGGNIKAGSSAIFGYGGSYTSPTLVPSHRLKVLREAMFMYEYFKTVPGSLNSLITNTKSWDSNYDHWQAARDTIALSYVSGGGPGPSPSPSPTPSSSPTPVPSGSPEPQPAAAGRNLISDIMTAAHDLFLRAGSGVVRMGGARVAGVADPTYINDAATKGYVDSHAGGGGGTITTKEILYGDGSSTPAHEAGFEYDASTNVCKAPDLIDSGLTASMPVFSDGSKKLVSGTVSGNTTKVVTTTGSLTTNNCAKWDASGNAVDAGTTCGGGGGAPTITVPNAGSTGTTVNTLAKLTGTGTAVITATTDTSGAIGIVTSGAGTTGSATIQTQGTVSCVFDGATTANDYVQISSTTVGDCKDAGATYPASGEVLGQVLSTNGSGGTYSMILYGIGIGGGTLGVPGGGTGVATLTNHSLVIASGTSALRAFGVMPANQVLLGQGAGTDPSSTFSPVFGFPGSNTGSLGFGGSTSGTITIKPGSNTAGTWNFNLPNTAGTAGAVMLSGGGGATTQTWSESRLRLDVASTATIAALANTNSFVKLTGSTATTIQGVTAGVDGQIITIVNLTGQTMTISNENGSATAANRITTMTGSDIATTGNGSVSLSYDTGSSRWLVTNSEL